MKRIIAIIIPLIFSLMLSAGGNTLAFSDISFEKGLQKAAMEDKMLVLYFYFDQCEACDVIEKKSFTNLSVIDFFSNHFVSIKINTGSETGEKLRKQLDVRIHPGIVFLNASGVVIHQIAAVFDPHDIIRHGNIALSNRSLSKLNKEYESGQRQPDFMREYIYLLNDAHLLELDLIQEYLNTLQTEDFTTDENIAFLYHFALHQFKISTPFESEAFQFIYNNKPLFYQYFDTAQIHFRITWIILETIYQAKEENNEAKFLELLEHLEKYDIGKYQIFREHDGRITGAIMNRNLVLSAKLEFYGKNYDRPKYLTAIEELSNALWYQPYDLNSLARDLSDASNDMEVLKMAYNCVERSVILNPGYDNSETKAILLYRLHRIDEAKAIAKQALGFVAAEEHSAKLAQSLLDKIADSEF